jgi:hypothetical protein
MISTDHYREAVSFNALALTCAARSAVTGSTPRYKAVHILTGTQALGLYEQRL